MAFCRYFSDISSRTAFTVGPSERSCRPIARAHGAAPRTSASANPLLGLRHPFEPLEIHERLRPAQDLRGAEAEQELLGPVERTHAQGPRPDALENVGVGA